MLQNERSQEMTRQVHRTEYVVRCLFERVGEASFVGHLDLMHTFDRAVRRAEMPIMYTQGYNPRPMMVFALPLGVGIDTLGDYVDISLSRLVDAEEFMEKVNPNLPSGVRLYGGINIDEPEKSLMSVVTTAMYRIKAPGIRDPLMRLFEKEEIKVEKRSKGKTVETDIRPLLLSGAQNMSSDPDICELYVCAGSVRNLRPDVLLSALCRHEGYDEELSQNAVITRLALFGGEYPRLLDIKGLL